MICQALTQPLFMLSICFLLNLSTNLRYSSRAETTSSDEVCHIRMLPPPPPERPHDAVVPLYEFRVTPRIMSVPRPAMLVAISPSQSACLGDNLSLLFMVLGIQYLVGNLRFKSLLNISDFSIVMVPTIPAVRAHNSPLSLLQLPQIFLAQFDR